MRWERATTGVRVICLLIAAAGFGMAWRLTWIGAQGIEDVPPPFTLLAGLLGAASLCVAAVGRYPSLAPGKTGERQG